MATLGLDSGEMIEPGMVRWWRVLASVPFRAELLIVQAAIGPFVVDIDYVAEPSRVVGTELLYRFETTPSRTGVHPLYRLGLGEAGPVVEPGWLLVSVRNIDSIPHRFLAYLEGPELTVEGLASWREQVRGLEALRALSALPRLPEGGPEAPWLMLHCLQCRNLSGAKLARHRRRCKAREAAIALGPWLEPLFWLFSLAPVMHLAGAWHPGVLARLAWCRAERINCGHPDCAELGEKGQRECCERSGRSGPWESRGPGA